MKKNGIKFEMKLFEVSLLIKPVINIEHCVFFASVCKIHRYQINIASRKRIHDDNFDESE